MRRDGLTSPPCLPPRDTFLLLIHTDSFAHTEHNLSETLGTPGPYTPDGSVDSLSQLSPLNEDPATLDYSTLTPQAFSSSHKNDTLQHGGKHHVLLFIARQTNFTFP